MLIEARQKLIEMKKRKEIGRITRRDNVSFYFEKEDYKGKDLFFEYSCCNDAIRKLFSIKIKFFGEQKKWDKIKDRNFIDPL